MLNISNKCQFGIPGAVGIPNSGDSISISKEFRCYGDTCNNPHLSLRRQAQRIAASLADNTQ